MRRKDQEHHDETEDHRLRACAACGYFLIGRARPCNLVALRKNLRSHFLHCLDGIARGETWCRITGDLRCIEGVEAFKLIRANNTFDGHKSIKRDHAAGIGPHEDMLEIAWITTELSLRLQVDLIVAAKQRKVVDVETAERCLHCSEYRVDRHTHSLRLFAIKLDVILRNVRIERRAHALQFRSLGRSLGDEFGRTRQRFDTTSGTILNIEFKATGRAEAHDRRRVECQHKPVLDARIHGHDGTGKIAGIGFRCRAFLPVLEHDEHRARTGFQTARQKIEAGYREDAFHSRAFPDIRARLIKNRRCALQRGRRRQDSNAEQVALIFVR